MIFFRHAINGIERFIVGSRMDATGYKERNKSINKWINYIIGI